MSSLNHNANHSGATRRNEVFGDLRRRNERRARMAKLQRKALLDRERLVEPQRQRRFHQFG
jgi:hypothetical protein